MIGIRSYILLIGYMLLSYDSSAQQMLRIEGGNEPSVAIHPEDPDHIVVATNVDRFYYTTDGGTSWSEIRPTSRFGIHGDPVLHYVGTQLYFAHLSKTKGKAWGDWFDRIVVQRIDAVESWDEQSYSVGFNNHKMQDKPWLSGDTSSTSAYQGRVYVSWTEFDKYGSPDPSHFSRIRFSSLSPGDSTFSPAITVSDTVGDCRDGDQTLEGAVTAVGPKGEIYMVWAGHGKIWFDRSLDGGNSWGSDRIIAQQEGSWAVDIPHLMRANGMPFIQIAPNGHLMVIYSEVINGKSMVRVCFSEDQGDTWNVLPMVAGKGDQYLPNLIATDHGFKSLHIDHRRSTTGFFFDVILSQYHWKADHYEMQTYPINPDPIPLPGERVFFGDYVDLDEVSGHTVGVYTSYDGEEVAVEVRPGSDARLQATDGLQLSWVVDRDSMHLVCRSSFGFRLEGVLDVDQGGTHTNVRIDTRFRPKGPSGNEQVITSVPLKAGEPMRMKWNASYCRGIFHKKVKIGQERFYP